MFTGEISVVNGEVILPETFECDTSGDVEISNLEYITQIQTINIDHGWLKLTIIGMMNIQNLHSTYINDCYRLKLSVFNPSLLKG